MADSDVVLLRSAWEAFSCGDLGADTEVLDAQVRWYGAGDEGAGCHNRQEALDFIRQALADGVTAELLDIRDAGDRVVLIVQSHAPAEWQQSREPHGELVTVRDGKVTEMVVFPPVEQALAAAGLG